MTQHIEKRASFFRTQTLENFIFRQTLHSENADLYKSVMKKNNDQAQIMHIIQFRSSLKYFAQTVTDFMLLSAENTKYDPFLDILVTSTLGVNMINRKMTLFFSSTL